LAEAIATVGEALRMHRIRAVLTGGACASVYSDGSYHSEDLDFIISGRVTQSGLDAAMASVGFARKGDRYVHPRIRYFVEFPRSPLAIGDDLAIRPVGYPIGGARVLALSATDSCRDRLAAFYHWDDRQSLAVAVAIALRNRVSMRRIRDWSRREGMGARFEEFEARVRRGRASAASSKRI
jgi:hypothetical protein